MLVKKGQATADCRLQTADCTLHTATHLVEEELAAVDIPLVLQGLAGLLKEEGGLVPGISLSTEVMLITRLSYCPPDVRP